jgi:tetratricopeptide (TPR) repeat protein
MVEIVNGELLPPTKRDILGIWYHDEDITDDEDLFYKMKTRLYETFTYVRIFDNVSKFTEYIKHLFIVENVFYIISGENAKSLCHIAQKRQQCKGVYEYQSDLDSISSPKAFTDLDGLFNKINDDIKPYIIEEEPIASSSKSIKDEKWLESTLPLSLGLLNSNANQNSFRYWTKESLEFFRFQALTRILTRIQFDHTQSLNEMLRECRRCYCGNTTVVDKIDLLKEYYQTELAIWYYTCDMFLFRMAGRAFRSEDFEDIFKFRRYIIDLNCELAKIHDQHAPSRITLYRGKKLPPVVIQQLKDNQGALVSMNGFLSTTKNEKVAKELYAGINENLSGYQSVLFEFSINDSIIPRPNADISSESQFSEEEEVLFSFGSVWRIDSVEKIDNLLWLIKLQSSNEPDSTLNQLFSQLPDNNPFLVLGTVLRELAQQTKAKNFYHRMLTEPMITDEIRGTLYFRIAEINLEQKDYTSALENLCKAENLIPLAVMELESTPSQSLCANSIVPSHLRIFNNMGLAYFGLSNYDSASEYFTKALDIEESDPIDKATVYDNKGMLLYSDGQYQSALQHLAEAVRLAQDYSCVAKFKQHYDNVKKHIPQDQL